MADQARRFSKLITQSLRHATSPPRDADVKETFSDVLSNPPRLMVVAFIFSEFRRGGWGGGRIRHHPVVEYQKSPVCIALRKDKKVKIL